MSAEFSITSEGQITVPLGACCVEWKIKDFLSVLSNAVYLYSPTFYLFNASWYLELSLKELSSCNVEHVCLFLVCAKSHILHRQDYKFLLGFKSSDGTLYKPQKSTKRFSDEENQIAMRALFKTDELKSESCKLFPDGVITCYCEFHLAENNEMNTESQSLFLQDDIGVLSRDLRDLFLSGENTDVTIKVENTEFQVHSQILAARSPVFKRMFTLDMIEKNSGIVQIEDCDPESFRILLVYLYSGKLESLTVDDAINLYLAAEKYIVSELKTHCSEIIMQNTSVDTICDNLSLAIACNDRELIKYGTDFFVKNAKEILPSVKWMSFMKKHMVEANELTIKALNYSEHNKRCELCV